MRKVYLMALVCLGVAGMAYAGANVYLLVMQRELIFEPSREVLKTPADLHLSYDAVWIPTRGSESSLLSGWWLPASNPASPVVLYLHGNDFNLSANLERVARLHELGFSVLAIDYRGFGNSGGDFPSEAQVYDDADSAWNYLIHARHFSPERTFMYGHSLGGAIALHLAVNHPEAAGVMLEAAFTSMSDMAKLRFGFFPVNWLLNQRFDSMGEISMLRVPVLFIHGQADTMVPPAMSEKLYHAANSPKQIVLISGGEHDGSSTIRGERYAKAVREFVAKAEANR